MDPQSVKSLIEKGLPDATVKVDSADGVHFQAEVVSARFAGKSRLARHRMVHAALGDLMGEAIHALSVVPRTPEEAASRGATG